MPEYLPFLAIPRLALNAHPIRIIKERYEEGAVAEGSMFSSRMLPMHVLIRESSSRVSVADTWYNSNAMRNRCVI